jgi:hypothetical protein
MSMSLRGVHLIDMYPTGMHLIDMHLTGVPLIGVHLMDMPLLQASLAGLSPRTCFLPPPPEPPPPALVPALVPGPVPTRAPNEAIDQQAYTGGNKAQVPFSAKMRNATSDRTTKCSKYVYD